ncbi:MAG: sulfatase-like hydrolase/transferase [Firmicutes bacterium]|nr:sulfatase-like hydrolase/transferase [Bacillota bacterium]
MVKELILAFSLANLCYYNVILRFFYQNKFYLKDLPGAKHFLALIIGELLITVLFGLAWRLVKKINNHFLVKFAKFLVCLLVLIFIFEFLLDISSVLDLNFKLIRIVLLITILYLIIKKKISQVALFILLLMTPFAGIVFIQSTQNIIIDLMKKPAPKIEQPIFTYQHNSPKVLWLIYDELDYRIPFVDRPKNLKMPTFDQLLGQALTAHNAYSPSKETITSLPSLIDGKLVSEVNIVDPETLEIKYRDNKDFINWGSQPNLFTKARQLKVNTALVGEYIPYTRLIGKDLTFCDWYQYHPRYTDPGSIVANVYQQLKMLLRGPARLYMQRKESYYDIQNLTIKLVSDPKFGLVMIHNPIPHHPYFYRMSWWDKRSRRSPEGYINALKLVDLSLGEIRQVMDEQGTWDKTTVIISADHGLRRRFDGIKDCRVPFIIKFAGQKSPIPYEPAFNTVITQELILEILGKKITSTEEVINFLNRNGNNEQMSF